MDSKINPPFNEKEINIIDSIINNKNYKILDYVDKIKFANYIEFKIDKSIYQIPLIFISNNSKNIVFQCIKRDNIIDNESSITICFKNESVKISFLNIMNSQIPISCNLNFEITEIKFTSTNSSEILGKDLTLNVLFDINFPNNIFVSNYMILAELLKLNFKDKIEFVATILTDLLKINKEKGIENIKMKIEDLKKKRKQIESEILSENSQNKKKKLEDEKNKCDLIIDYKYLDPPTLERSISHRDYGYIKIDKLKKWVKDKEPGYKGCFGMASRHRLALFIDKEGIPYQFYFNESCTDIYGMKELSEEKIEYYRLIKSEFLKSQYDKEKI